MSENLPQVVHKRLKKNITLSRRDFLKLADITTAVAFTIGSSSKGLLNVPDVTNTMDSLPYYEEEMTGREIVSSLAHKVQVVGAVVSTLKAGVDENTERYLRKRYHLDRSVTDLLTDSEAIQITDIGLIIEAYGKGKNFGDEFSEIYHEANSEDGMEIIGSIYKTRDWKKFVEEHQLGADIVRLGSDGKAVLERLGIDLTDFKLHKELVGEGLMLEDIKEGAKRTECLLLNNNNSDNSVAFIGHDEKAQLFQFDRSSEGKSRAQAKFILKRLTNLTQKNMSDELLASLPTKEFIKFQSWIYKEYKDLLEKRSKRASQIKEGRKIPSGSSQDLSEDDFFKKIDDKLTSQREESQDSFIGRANFILKDLEKRIDEKASLDLVSSAIRGDLEAFNLLISTMTPGGKSIFNDKKSCLEKSDTYEIILNEASIGGSLSKEKLVTTAQKYSSNLFLENIVDRVASDEDQRRSTNGESVDYKRMMADIVSGRMTLQQVADCNFGSTKFIYHDKDGRLDGSHLGDTNAEMIKVTEPTSEVPEKLLKILDITEHEAWKSGKEYLIEFIERNALNKFKKTFRIGDPMPPTGSSSDTITAIESVLFPGPFDFYSSSDPEKKDKKYMFRRTDLYGTKYLMHLYEALKNDKAVPDLYEFDYLHSPGTPQDPEPNGINRMCAKLESKILERDFINDKKFGNKTIIDLLVQYVPIGSAQGIQLYGLETGANYYFGKKLSEVNDGEIAVLVGMIQGPTEYSPNLKDATGINIKTIKRATYVASLCEKAGMDVSQMRDQIKKLDFHYVFKDSWITTYDEKERNDLFRSGDERTRGVDIGVGIRVRKKGQGIPINPDTIDLPRYANPGQIKAEEWFKSIILKEQLTIKSHEFSLIALVTREALAIFERYDPETWNERGQLQKEIAELANKILQKKGKSFQYTSAITDFKNGKINNLSNPYENGSPEQDLVNSLYEWEVSTIAPARSKTYDKKDDIKGFYQCGQFAILFNSLIRTEIDIREPELGRGSVESWMATLGANYGSAGYSWGRHGDDKDLAEVLGHQYIRLDQDVLINPIKNRTNLFNIGDMIVSWVNHEGGGGHVNYVVDKGIDSEGRTWIKVLDANYNSRGDFRIQMVWPDDLPTTLFPGKPRHIAVIRPKGLAHGLQVPPINNGFLDHIFLAKIGKEKEIILPGYDQSSLTDTGSYTPMVNPGVAIVEFGENGTRSIDKTGILSDVPIIPGNSLKPLLYGFLMSQGVDPKSELLYYPGYYASDGSGKPLSNAEALFLNMDNSDALISLEQAFACNLDVPLQIAFNELLDKDPSTWDKYQEYLNFWGVELVDIKSNPFTAPTAFGALGRDVYVKNIYSLNNAIASFLNAREMVGVNSIDARERNILIEASEKTNEALFSTQLRKSLKISLRFGEGTLETEVGHDIYSQSVVNGIFDTIINGKEGVVTGTRIYGSGDSAQYIYRDESGKIFVVTSTALTNTDSMARVSTRMSMAQPGLIPVTIGFASN